MVFCAKQNNNVENVSQLRERTCQCKRAAVMYHDPSIPIVLFTSSVYLENSGEGERNMAEVTPQHR
jgi:hypothetical protein